AALQRRLVPDTTLQPTDLAERVGVDLPTVLDWIDGRREPSSSQFGRLIAALDPAFVVDVYGEDVEAMRHRFGEALAQARQAETRRRGRAPPSKSCVAERGDARGDFGATAAERGRWRAPAECAADAPLNRPRRRLPEIRGRRQRHDPWRARGPVRRPPLPRES